LFLQEQIKDNIIMLSSSMRVADENVVGLNQTQFVRGPKKMFGDRVCLVPAGT